MLKSTKEIEKEILNALEKYSSDNIDIVRDEETGCIYIIYHSFNNSFPVSKTSYCSSQVNFIELEKLAEKYHIGYMW